MKVLVLGGCGFIGSHVVDQLTAFDQDVRVFDRTPERFREQRHDVEYIYGDFRDGTVVAEALTDIDCVIHLVSTTVPGTAALNPQADVRDNLIPTISLLESMNKLAVPRLIYLSSGGTVYGVPNVIPTPESHALRPVSSYGIVKTAIEHYINLYSRTLGITAAIIRPSNPFGPRQAHLGTQGVVSSFLNRILNNDPIQVWGDGSTIRDYIYIEDLAELCATIALSGKAGNFNAGTGVGMSISDVIDVMRMATSAKIEVVYREPRQIDVPQSVLDMSYTKSEFKWEPQVSFSDGVRRYWDWLKGNRRT